MKTFARAHQEGDDRMIMWWAAMIWCCHIGHYLPLSAWRAFEASLGPEYLP